jgi:hypothetical protein
VYGRYARQPEIPHASLTPAAGGFAFASSFDAAMVAEMKRLVPADSRKWDNTAKVWLVAPAYGQTCADLARKYLGVSVRVPALVADTSPTIKLLRVEYIGRTKPRDGGDSSAFAWVNGGWNAIIPESALRAWFEAEPQRPGEKPTLYAALGVKAAVSVDELRSAYRRMARQWHPDVCREPDAAEQFKAIQHAYEVLGDPIKRRKYDAGLALSASLASAPQPYDRARDFSYTMDGGYRSALRCGWLLCEGREVLGRFVVATILQWEDVVDSQGRVMVTSWPAGADTFAVAWR